MPSAWKWGSEAAWRICRGSADGGRRWTWRRRWGILRWRVLVSDLLGWRRELSIPCFLYLARMGLLAGQGRSFLLDVSVELFLQPPGVGLLLRELAIVLFLKATSYCFLLEKPCILLCLQASSQCFLCSQSFILLCLQASSQCFLSS